MFTLASASYPGDITLNSPADIYKNASLQICEYVILSRGNEPAAAI